MLCNVAGFASLCHAMKCHVPGFCHCGVVCVLATVTIAAGSILYSHNMWFPIFPGSVFFSCSSRYAKLCHGIAMQLSSCYCCRWSSLCMVCAMLYLSVPGGLHVITRPVHLCVHSHKGRGLLFTVVSHTRFPHVFPWDVIVTEDSFSARRPTARGTWLVGQPGVDINNLCPIYVQLVQNNSPPSLLTPLPAF